MQAYSLLFSLPGQIVNRNILRNTIQSQEDNHSCGPASSGPVGPQNEAQFEERKREREGVDFCTRDQEVGACFHS